MFLKNIYWWHQDVLPVNFIDDLFHLVKDKKFDTAITSDIQDKKITKKLIKKLKEKVRDTSAVFVNDPWIFQVTNPIVNAANSKAGWNFKWDWNESAQFGKYAKQQYYSWHIDSLNEPYNNPGNPQHGKIRKLSTIISLNDSSEYKGGEVLFDARDTLDGSSRIIHCKELQKKGTVVTFPSFVWHTVKPVTKGVRYSLVIWHLGDPFI